MRAEPFVGRGINAEHSIGPGKHPLRAAARSNPALWEYGFRSHNAHIASGQATLAVTSRCGWIRLRGGGHP